MPSLLAIEYKRCGTSTKAMGSACGGVRHGGHRVVGALGVFNAIDDHYRLSLDLSVSAEPYILLHFYCYTLKPT